MVSSMQVLVGMDWGQAWRSPDGTSWTKVVDNGFNDPDNSSIEIFTVFNNALYACTRSTNTHGLEIWRTSTGNTHDWVKVVNNGFNNNLKNRNCTGFALFNNYLYAVTESSSDNPDGVEIWRTDNGRIGSRRT